MNRKTRLGILTVLMVVSALGTASLAMAGKPVVHGIISQGYLKSSEYNYLIPSEVGSFAYNEVLLNISASVSDNVRVGAQMMARNFGNEGNEDLVLDWAYGDYRMRDEFGIRVGKVKTPFGFYNQTRDVDMVRNSILLPQSVYGEIFRDVMNAFEGASVYGTLAVGDAASFEYEAFYGTVDVERTQFPVPSLVQPMLAPFHGGSMPVSSWSAEVKAVQGAALRFNTPLEGFRVGASVFDADMAGSGTFTSPFGPFNPTLTLEASPWWVLSAEYTTDRWVFVGEWSRLDAEVGLHDVLMPTGMDPPAPAAVVMDLASEDNRGGYYGQATFQLNDWVQLGSYYSMYYPDYGTRDADGHGYYQRDIAFTARFDIQDNWLLKLEAHTMAGTGDVRGTLNPGSTFAEENWTLFGAKSTFYF